MDGFAAVCGDRWDELVTLGRPAAYGPGDVLVRQGEEAREVFLLLAGRVKVSLVDAGGNSLLLAVRGPGQVLGDITLIDRERRSATVSAIDACRVRVVPLAPFAARLDELGLRDALTRFAMRRLRESEELRLELATLRAGARIVRGLVRLGVPARLGERAVDIGLSQAEFGEALGLSRASVADMFAELRAQGLVSTKRGRIVITDLARLRAMAGE